MEDAVTTERHAVSVELVPNASDALNQIKISKGYTDADAINRAIQLSSLVERKLSEGFSLAFARKDKHGEVTELEVVQIQDYN